MATRSTITIHDSRKGFNKPLIHLYRHWDGGLWGAGLDIARLIKRYGARPRLEPRIAVSWFIGGRAESRDAAQYEWTDEAALHADTQWHYNLFVIPDGLTAQALERPTGHPDFKAITAGAFFRQDVAKELLACRNRLKVYRVERVRLTLNSQPDDERN